MLIKTFLPFSIVFFFVFIFSYEVQAQRIEFNSQGEKIVLFPNGTWEYYDKTNPTHISAEEEAKEGEIASPTDILDEQTSKGGDNAMERYQALLDEAEERLALAEENESDVKFSKILIEEEIEDLKNDDEATDEQYNQLKEQLKLAKLLEKDAKKETKKAKKELEKLKKQGKIIQKSSKRKAKRRKKNKSAEPSKNTGREDGTFYLASKKFKKYSIDKDVMYNPPQQECNLAFDGIDEFIGKKRRDVERDVLFTFTDDNMRRYLTDDDYIICEGNLTQIKGGVLLLNLFISIKSSDAPRSFGALEKGSVLTLKMIDGSSVNLVNNQSDNGVFDPLKKRHNYVGQYRINGGQTKTLKKGEVDKVRIIWGTGYEDYDVYNLDFFVNQFKCLNK